MAAVSRYAQFSYWQGDSLDWAQGLVASPAQSWAKLVGPGITGKCGFPITDSQCWKES
jgi:hypothetical protein